VASPSQTVYTGNILTTLQGIDNNTALALFSVAREVYNNDCGLVQFTTVPIVSTSSYPVANGQVLFGFYVKNLSTGYTTGDITVTWNNGSTDVQAVVLPTNGVIMFFFPNGPHRVNNVRLISSVDGVQVEMAVWA